MPTHGNTADQAKLDAANKMYLGVFVDELDNMTESPLVELSTMKTRSKSKVVEYDWLLNYAQMQEWIGERKVADFKAKNYAVANRKYEMSIHVDRVDIDADNLGLYTHQIRSFPQEYTLLRRRLIADLLLTNGDGYDGVSFFNGTHPAEGSEGTQSNTSGSSASLTDTNFDAGVQAMAELKNHKNDPLEVYPTHIVVGPSNYAAARNLFELPTLSGGGDNPHFNAVTVIREPRITTDDWFLLDLSKSIKPFILQDADDLELQMITDANAQYVIEKDGFFYGTRARFAIANGFWQLAYRGEA